MSDLKEMWWYRITDTWATRDSAIGKLEYSKFINPQCDYSFAKYMKTKQLINGEYRPWDNWQKWLWFMNCFESFVRHTEILKLLVGWNKVYEYKQDWEIILEVNPKEVDPSWEEKQLETELNALRFNSEAMKLEILLGRFELSIDTILWDTQ